MISVYHISGSQQVSLDLDCARACRGNLAAGSEMDGFSLGLPELLKGGRLRPVQPPDLTLIFVGNTAHSNRRHGVKCCQGLQSLQNATLDIQQLLRQDWF